LVEDFDLTLTGFDPDEIAAYTVETTEGLTDEDEAPPVKAFALTEPGDFWTLGHHRLLCGDSTSVDMVEHLMHGQKTDMVFTDPPYNVDYEGYTEERLTIQGDRMDGTRFSEFLRDTFASLRSVTTTEASLYVCHSSSWQREFQQALEEPGSKYGARSSGRRTPSPGGSVGISFSTNLSFMPTSPARVTPGRATRASRHCGRRRSRRRIACIRQ
jgi:hypothetical protein